MNFRIVHHTEYTFDQPVFPEPHILRFRPRTDFRQHLKEYSLQIEPLPSGRNEYIDEYGNISEISWYSELKHSLQFRAESIVGMREFKPFDFLVYPDDNLRLPVRSHSNPVLLPYLVLCDNNSEIQDLYEELVRQSSGNTLDFLINATSLLHSSVEKITRESGKPLEPSVTLSKKKGSCRDITVLHMELIRKAGIPARFVSGYHYVPGNEQNHELHAWTEAFLGGAGWIGFDATTGLAVTGYHVAVATGPVQPVTLPVEGTYRGSASSSIRTMVDISEMPEIH